jgi:hypothetical protein
LLAKIISLITSSKPDYHNFINNWITLCATITAESELIELCIPGFSHEWEEEKNPPYLGYFESHCLGVALWCRVTDINDQRYRLVQAMLILSVNLAKQIASQKKFPIEEQLAGACLSVRKLSRAQYADILASLPDAPMPIKSYRILVDKIVNNTRHILYPLLHLLEIATDIKVVLIRGSFEKHPERPINVIEEYMTDSDDKAHPGEINKILQIKDVSKKSATYQLAKNALCHPQEFIGRDEAIATEAEGKDPSGGRSRSQQYIEARAAAERISFDNQRLATGLDRLLPCAIDFFLEKLDQLSTEDGLIGNIKRTELAAFLAVCFWTSRTTKDAILCTVVPSAAKSREAISIFAETDGKLYWIVYAPKPLLKKQIEIETEHQALLTADRFTLPFTTLASKAISPWLRENPSKKYCNHNIFFHQSHEYDRATEEFFKDLKKKSNGRQNFFRISIYLHDLVSRLPGSDATAAIAISGRSDKIGKIPHFYTAHTIEKIQTLYSMAVSDIGSSEEDKVRFEPIRGSSSTYVGSRFVPRRKVIATFVIDVRDRLAKLRSEPNSYENIVRLHNALTAYTVLLVGFATGYRAVSDPLFHDAEIDRTSGFAVISDKDGDDFYNSRIVWLPPVCLEQLDHYATHLKYFSKWLFTYNQGLFFKSRKNCTVGRRADRKTPALFYLDRDTEEFTVRPSHLKALMQQVNYHLPVNANRHYLRTNLLERKCPLEVINAFMGHWERGVEPWGKYSGLSPDVYRSELAYHLVKLLAEDKWTAEKGLVNWVDYDAR